MRGLDGKVALVTGAARGQGRAIAARLIEEGCSVVLADVLETETTAAELGPKALPVRLDVTDADGWIDTVREIEDRFKRLDVLVNAAGIACKTPLDRPNAEGYLRVIGVNQVGVFLAIQAVRDLLAKSGGGSIVNISSIDGFVAVAGLAGYVSSKFAMRGITKVAALELAADNIRVNSVHPGYVDTPMLSDAGMDAAALQRCAEEIPLRRIATTADIASVVAFLASADSAYCTGSEILVDGGLLAGRRLAGEGLQ